MKLSQILLRQHIGKHFEKHWRIQGLKKAYDSGVATALAEKGIQVFEPEEILKQQRPLEKFEVVGYIPKEVKFDNTHPNWHDRVCYTYKDGNVLLEGLTQAKILTKTVELTDGLPDKLTIKKSDKDIDSKVKKIILSSHLFDAEQQKLPKIKDSERPAWNFRRPYGITDRRINKLLTFKLLQLIELIGDPQLVKQRSILADLPFSFPFEKSGDLIQFELRGDALLTTSKPLSPISAEQTEGIELPNIFPIKDTITLNLENVYDIKNMYPIKQGFPKAHPHTVFVHYNGTEVKNIYEEEVTESQVFGRSLLKTFTVAASYARQMYGLDIQTLPKPITVQCVHTDGRLFHFGIFQLNTLQLEGADGVKNIWFQTPRIPLFSQCCYAKGKPMLEGYNSDVISTLLTFYHNI